MNLLEAIKRRIFLYKLKRRSKEIERIKKLEKKLGGKIVQ